MLLRTLLWALCLPLMALVVLGYRFIGGVPGAETIGVQEVQALTLLALANDLRHGRLTCEQHVPRLREDGIPGRSTNQALLKVTLGVLVLLLGWGYVGLAGVALLVNMLQVLWLYWPPRTTLFNPQWKWDCC